MSWHSGRGAETHHSMRMIMRMRMMIGGKKHLLLDVPMMRMVTMMMMKEKELAAEIEETVHRGGSHPVVIIIRISVGIKKWSRMESM